MVVLFKWESRLIWRPPLKILPLNTILETSHDENHIYVLVLADLTQNTLLQQEN